MSYRINNSVEGVVVTTGTTVTQAASYALQPASTAYANVRVCGRVTSGANLGASVVAEMQVGAKCLSTTAALVGAATTAIRVTDTALNATVVAFAVSGANVIVNVTGIASTNIEWRASLNVLVH